jgi:hypothetical protein
MFHEVTSGICIVGVIQFAFLVIAVTGSPPYESNKSTGVRYSRKTYARRLGIPVM